MQKCETVTRDYGLQEVLEAIRGSAGLTSPVARKLDCAWHTAKKYIEKWETTRRAFANEGEQVIDFAEQKVIEAMRDGDGPMLRWYLSTKGKHRGYTERHEIAGTGEDGAIEIKQAGLTDAERRRVLEHLATTGQLRPEGQ